MIQFGVWARSEQAFWDTWIAAGICESPGVYRPGYAGCIDTTAGAWDGTVYKQGSAVAGWHCNVRVSGPLYEQFTAGLAQTDADGNLLSVWSRTHAAAVFGLTNQAADAATGFPAGMRSASGVTYADANAFSSPSNVWA